MGDTHLDELRNALEQKGWNVVSQEDGDDYRISAVWRIQRSTRAEPTNLLFAGLDDMRTLPIEQAYACEVQGRKDVSLYFGSMKEFRKALPGFIAALDHVERDAIMRR
jgi:hypothetical protein